MIILCGPSATGKSEIAKLLNSKYNMQKVITHTTRPMRINEINNVDYHFVSKNEFLSLQAKKEFVETAVYNNNFYGSSKKEIAKNKCCILEPKGVKAYKELKDPSIIIFFLLASEETRIKRMEIRNDSQENIKSRIENDRLAFDKKENLANYIIDTENKSLDEIVDEIYKLYKQNI